MRAIGLLVFFQVRYSVIKLFTDPRRLIPAILLAAFYIWLIIGSGSGNPMTQAMMGQGDMASIFTVAHAVALVVLAFIAVSVIGTGFSPAYLAFSAADIDYLMPSPVSRRALLALKLIRLTAGCLAGTCLLWLMLGLCMKPLLPGVRMTRDAEVLAQIAIFCCLAGCTQIGMAITVHFGRRPGGYIISQIVLFLMVAALMGIGVTGGADALIRTVNAPAVNWLFFPCRWTADAMLAALDGTSDVGAAVLASLFYIATLPLIFARDANFYETAVLATQNAEQLKEVGAKSAGMGRMSLQFAERHQRANSNIGRWHAERDYTIMPFGTGAMAICWANLACAAKRPWLNFAGPASIGIFLGGLAIWQPETAGTLVGVTAMILSLFTLSSGVFAYLPALLRRPLIGPLPIAPWKIACAEIFPFAVTCCLPIWALAATVTIGRVPGTANMAIVLVTSVPIMMIGLAALPYIVVTNVVNLGHDKIAQLLAQLALFTVFPLVVATYVPMLVVPLSAGFSSWFSAIAAAPGCALVSGLLLSLAGRSYAGLRDEGETRSLASVIRDLPRMPRRLPALDEALCLAVLLLTVAAYNGFWLAKYGFLTVVAVNEAIYLGLPVAFAWLGCYDWRSVFSWVRPTLRQAAGGALMGIGAIPLFGALNLIQKLLWPTSPVMNNLLLHFLATELAAHPILTTLLAGAMAGFCEEMAFRGPIQTALVKQFGVSRGILICAFAFAAWHLDFSGLLFRTGAGVLLGWIVWRGKSIFPAMLAHAALDASLFGYYAWTVRTHGVGALHSLTSYPPHFALYTLPSRWSPARPSARLARGCSRHHSEADRARGTS